MLAVLGNIPPILNRGIISLQKHRILKKYFMLTLLVMKQCYAV